LITLTFQQVFRLQSVATHVVGHHHSIEGGSFGGGILGHVSNPYAGAGIHENGTLETHSSPT
jgi:hypothetical protein